MPTVIDVASETSVRRDNIRVNWHATIRAAFEADPHAALTTKDIIMRAYGIGLEDITRSQRVAAVRAMKSFTRNHPRYLWMDGEGNGGQVVLFDSHDVLSYGLACLKADWVHGYQVKRSWRRQTDTEAQLRERLAGRDAKNIQPGGAWWRQVELWKAQDSGDRKHYLEMQRESIVACVRVMTGLGIRPRDSDLDELRKIEKELQEIGA